MQEQDDRPPMPPAEVGYGKPPRHSRFKPGQSGNARGRPKRRVREAPYDAVLSRTVTIRENGIDRKVTAAEAFTLQLARRGLADDNRSARALLRSIEDIRRQGVVSSANDVTAVVRQMVSPGSVNSALEALLMADLLDQYSPEHARM